MKVNDYLAQSTKRLNAAGITTGRLDCLVLLEDVLNTNRTQVLAHPERELTEVEKQRLDDMVTKRVQHVPLAYIRGKTEFYGRTFAINTHVLEPRPESETMIDLLKDLPKDNLSTIADIGTGSGALAITAFLELPGSTVVATDISPPCLKLAQRNAQTLKANITFYEGDLLNALPASFDNRPLILLCNLPYVPDNFQINTAASHEPRIALFGGPDGLDIFRKLFHQISTRRQNNTVVLCESLPPQHQTLTEIAHATGFEPVAEQDFIQAFSNLTSATD